MTGTTVEIIGLDETVDEHEEHSVAHEIGMGVTRVVGQFPSLADADIDVTVDITDVNEGGGN